MRNLWFVVPLALGALGCAAGTRGAGASVVPPLAPSQRPVEPADPAPVRGKGSVLIRGATVMTAAGTIHQPGYVLFTDGKLAAVGAGEPASLPEGAQVIDGAGKWVTPGLIDDHSHIGVYPMPGGEGHSDGNEMTGATTPHVWAEHGFWPQDPALWRAASGGVTMMQVLPGSANLIGGRSFTVKLRPDVSARAMRVPGAPQGLKMACGENPKRVYGTKGQPPMTRMGNIAGFRQAFQKAVEYRRAQQKYERDLAAWKERQEKGGRAPKGDGPDDPPDAPARDFGLETLALVLDGKILVHNHCYRADEMSAMLDLAKEFGFKIRSFHHSLEAYKIADRLAAEGVAASTWNDWWGFKLEAFDGIPENAAILTVKGARAILHSDSPREIRRLNQEAGKSLADGRRAGLELTEDQALRWITANPAWAMGLEERTGTLEQGKDADVVLWSAHPFSVYARAERVWADGILIYDRQAGPRLSDFELGYGSELGSGEEGQR